MIDRESCAYISRMKITKKGKINFLFKLYYFTYMTYPQQMHEEEKPQNRTYPTYLTCTGKILFVIS